MVFAPITGDVLQVLFILIDIFSSSVKVLLPFTEPESSVMWGEVLDVRDDKFVIVLGSLAFIPRIPELELLSP